MERYSGVFYQDFESISIMDKKQGLLLLIVLYCALSIRLPQLNFPSIGYHNTKENECISMAKNMLKNKDLISRDVSFYNAFTEKKDFGLYPQIPFVAYQVLLGYKLFGDNLWFPRLINIILMLLSVVTIFCLANIFTRDYMSSLAAAVLLGIMPLGVYFSRNLQPESGAFFFMTLGNLLFIKFIQEFKRNYLLGLAFCIFMTAGYKVPFLFGFLPLLFILPYNSWKKTNFVKQDILILTFPIILLITYFVLVGQISFSASYKDRVNFFSIYTLSYWKTNGPVIWYYANKENFTLIYLLLSAAGLVILWKNFKKDTSLFARYLRVWSLVIIPYFMFFSDYLNQHSYYMFPFLGFICLIIVYFMREASIYIANLINIQKKKYLFFLLIFVISFLLALSSLIRSIKLCFLTIYPGTEEIGKLIKGLTKEEDRFFLYATQVYATCVYAERKCGCCDSLDELKNNEKKFGIKYIVISSSYLKEMKEEIKKYIRDNYHLRLIGISYYETKKIMDIILLERKGVLDFKQFFNKKNMELWKVYHTIGGSLKFYISKNKN